MIFEFLILAQRGPWNLIFYKITGVYKVAPLKIFDNAVIFYKMGILALKTPLI